VTLSRTGEQVHRSARHDAERTLLAILCRHPVLFDGAEDAIGSLGFADPDHDRLRQALISVLSGCALTASELAQRLDAAGVDDLRSAVVADPLIRVHRLIAVDAAIDDVRATWRENIALLRRLDSDEAAAPAASDASDDDLARRVARKRRLLGEASDMPE
jgi:hypothetical protein